MVQRYNGRPWLPTARTEKFSYEVTTCESQMGFLPRGVQEENSRTQIHNLAKNAMLILPSYYHYLVHMYISDITLI